MPKVSVIITSYFEKSKPYLDLCVQSVKNLDYPASDLEIIIVGRKDYLPRYEGVRTVTPNEVKFWPPVGLNYGIAKSTGEYLFVINDDTVLTRNSLKALVETYAHVPRIGLLMPISNDQQNRYAALVGTRPGPMRLDEVDEPERLMNMESPYPLALSYHSTLCIYAFLISRKMYNEVGPFDESLIGQDDIDYTLRIGQKGYLNAIAYNAIVYHFGGVSSEQTFSAANREESKRRFDAKWG